MSGACTGLQVWQAAMDLAEDVYRITKNFPKEETYGLTVQLRRAAVSVPSNIAEGTGRSSDKELAQFLATREDPCLRSRRRSPWPAVWDTLTHNKQKLFSVILPVSASF
jgi:hypothetical protein